MSKARIVQLLCPQRHCIVATAYESPDGAEMPEMSERLLEWFAKLLAAGANPWCDICHSRNLKPEDRATRFATLAEAKPHLKESALRQAATLTYLKGARN